MRRGGWEEGGEERERETGEAISGFTGDPYNRSVRRS